jgi:heme exporter protein B
MTWCRQVRKVWALVWKDILVELRARQFVAAMLAFTLITIVTLNFAFDLIQVDAAANGAGALWTAYFFAGMLGIGRSIAVERDRGTFDGLLLTPVDRGTLFFGKFLATLVAILLIEFVTLIAFTVLYDLPGLDPLVVMVVIAGTVGFVGLGTLFSALASHGRAREVLLPLLLFPLVVPVLIAAVRATTLVFQGERADFWPWFNLLVGFDVLFLTMAWAGFGFVIED